MIGYMLYLYGITKITAADLCILCYYGMQAGAYGEGFELYGLPPNLDSGRYQKHLDAVLPPTAPSTGYYPLTIPCRDKSGIRREMLVPMVPVHETIAAECTVTPEVKRDFDYWVRTTDWGGRYAEHPRVRDRPAGSPLPLPLAVYLDGVQYSLQNTAGHTRSLLLISVYNLVSLKRHVCVCLRKIDLCACGCRGWCSLWPVFQCLAWQLESLSTGTRPNANFDQTPWTDAESVLWRAGTALGVTCCLLFIKGDWAEHTATMGFPNWASIYHPCVWCSSPLSVLYNFEGTTLDHSVWDAAPDYEAACAACEKLVRITTEPERHSLYAIGGLSFSLERGGLSLAQDVPAFELLRGDKLVPSLSLPDVGKVRNAPLPLNLTFWRTILRGRAIASPVHRRNPLFNAALGTSPSRSLAIDLLHGLHLGPVKHLIGWILWRLVWANPWQCEGLVDYQRKACVTRLRVHLHAWYSTSNVPLDSRFDDLTIGMLGPPSQPGFKGKAVETAHLLPWTIALLEEHRAHVPFAPEMLEAARALLSYMNLLREAPFIVPVHTCQTLLDLFLRHCWFLERADIGFLPKHHAMVHATALMHITGNMRFFATFHDESLNAIVALLARHCHPRSWPTRIYERLSLLGRLKENGWFADFSLVAATGCE